MAIAIKYLFNLIDQSTLDFLKENDEDLLPTKKVNRDKDIAWNNKLITSQLMQGIQAGEPIEEIAKRLFNIIKSNEASSIRNARTMTTYAENRGRLDSYKKAASDGIILKKEWMSTGDDRTRDWHAELDGQSAEIDEPFVNAIGEIMEPGDPSADPSNVWNCRCSMRSRIKGFKKADGSISWI